MTINFKKKEERRLTYIPKKIKEKHKHNYIIEYILEITNDNIHATGNYYNKKEYYQVLKCNQCDSFIPSPKKGNSLGLVLNNEYDKNLPLIKAKTNMKCPAYNYNNLYDVEINNNK